MTNPGEAEKPITNPESEAANKFVDSVEHIQLNADTASAEEIVRSLHFMACASGYALGHASRDAEVAELKKRIDALEKLTRWQDRQFEKRGIVFTNADSDPYE